MTPERVLETRNVKPKASRVLGRTALDAEFVDTSKAFAGLLAQIQNIQQGRLGLIQAQLTDQLDNWKAEQRIREGALKE